MHVYIYIERMKDQRIMHVCVHSYTRFLTAWSITEIPTIIDPSATINYPSATGSIIVGISVDDD
jgi:hypothetical protein